MMYREMATATATAGEGSTRVHHKTTMSRKWSCYMQMLTYIYTCDKEMARINRKVGVAANGDRW
jgi:hypothetical protein